MPAARFALRISLAVLLLLASVYPIAQAAESYDNCTGFIDSLPVVVSTQGVWCLRSDLATAITTGRAIDATANNITVDCNNFKVGGLAAGRLSQATGLFSIKNNFTVRNCSVRGFAIGILSGGSGHVIEDNRIEGSLLDGVLLVGTAGVVRRNQVMATGGAVSGDITAIQVQQGIDVIDNLVDGVESGPGGVGTGIAANVSGDTSIINNRVRNVMGIGVGSLAIAIYISGPSAGSASLRGNTLGNSGGGTALGIHCHGPMDIASDNHLVGFSSSLAAEGCTVGPGNVER